MDIEVWRVLCAFLTGVLISQGGSLIQALSKNNLASPATLGFQALGVLVVLLANTISLFSWSLQWRSLALGLSLIILMTFFWRKKKRVYSNRSRGSMESILLLGLATNLFIGAMFAIWHFYSMLNHEPFPSQIWFGHFKYVDKKIALFFALFFLINLAFHFFLVRKMEILSLGESFFTALGKNIESLQKKVILLVLCQTFVIVSFFGVFSFSALIIPLILKRFSFFSQSFFREFFLGGFLGGVFFSLLDYLCYEFTIQGAELPLGMLTSTLGSFIMIFLLIGKRLA